MYKLHGHVHTGDLELIENIPLRNMKIGARFRETPPCNTRKLTHLYQYAIEKLTKKVARSTKSKIIIFDSWKPNITQEIDKVSKSLPITFKSRFIMDKPEVRKHIGQGKQWFWYCEQVILFVCY